MKYILNIILILCSFINFAWADTADPMDHNTWLVTPSSYENNMTIISGLLIIDNDTLENTNSKIAAFVGNDCRGTASLEYIPTFDAYMVSFFVYGSGANENVEFFIYDADTDVVLLTDNIEPFVTNASFGTFANPYLFSATSFNLSFIKEDNLCLDGITGSIETSYLGGIPPYNINWNTGETSENIEDLATGWYYVTATDGNGFVVSDSVEIQDLAVAIPLPQLLSLPDTTICTGSDAVLVAYADGFPDASFNWYNAGGDLLGTENTLIIPNFIAAETIFCETKIGSCSSSLNSISLNTLDLDIDFSISSSTVIQQEELVQFEINNPNPDYDYYWTFGDNGWSTDMNPYYYYNLAGDFDVSLTVTDLVNSCSKTITKTDYVTVLEPVLRPGQFESLPDYILAAFAFPNPFTDQLTVVLKPTNVGEHRISLYNILGRELKAWHHDSNGSVEKIVLDQLPNDLPKGTYVLYIESTNNHTSHKIVKR